MRKITFLGPKPDPFRKDDGSIMTKDEWYAQRGALRDFVVDHEYGGMPPRPEVVRRSCVLKKWPNPSLG